jgi:hypothetical protein
MRGARRLIDYGELPFLNALQSHYYYSPYICPNTLVIRKFKVEERVSRSLTITILALAKRYGAGKKNALYHILFPRKRSDDDDK